MTQGRIPMKPLLKGAAKSRAAWPKPAPETPQDKAILAPADKHYPPMSRQERATLDVILSDDVGAPSPDGSGRSSWRDVHPAPSIAPRKKEEIVPVKKMPAAPVVPDPGVLGPLAEEIRALFPRDTKMDRLLRHAGLGSTSLLDLLSPIKRQINNALGEAMGNVGTALIPLALMNEHHHPRNAMWEKGGKAPFTAKQAEWVQFQVDQIADEALAEPQRKLLQRREPRLADPKFRETVIQNGERAAALLRARAGLEQMTEPNLHSSRDR